VLMPVPVPMLVVVTRVTMSSTLSSPRPSDRLTHRREGPCGALFSWLLDCSGDPFRCGRREQHAVAVVATGKN
jgi:hypothetical protein